MRGWERTSARRCHDRRRIRAGVCGGFKAELTRALEAAFEAGVLKIEPDEVAWPFLDVDEKKPSEPPAFEPEKETESMTLRIWLLDRNRQRMPDAPYRLRRGNETRRGTAKDRGLAVARNLILEPEGFLEWGSVPIT